MLASEPEALDCSLLYRLGLITCRLPKPNPTQAVIHSCKSWTDSTANTERVLSRSKEAAEPLEPPDPSLLSQEWKESLAATPKQEQLLVIAFFSTFLRALVYKFINKYQGFKKCGCCWAAFHVLCSVNKAKSKKLPQEGQTGQQCSPASMLTTDKRIFSTLCTGLHRSALLSYPMGSSPGAWRIEMHTLPSG